MQNAQIVPNLHQFGFRGHSRSSNTRGASQGNTGQLQHPGTSNSLKRQNYGAPPAQNQTQTMNINLAQKNVSQKQSKNLEFMPIPTSSYTTTGKSIMIDQNKGKASIDQTQMRYSNLITNSQNGGGQQLGINGMGVNIQGQSQHPIGMVKAQSAVQSQNQKIVNGAQVVFENQTLQMLNQNISKSKQKLMQASKTIDPISNTQIKQASNMDSIIPINQNNFATQELLSPKPIIQNANIQNSKNAVTVIGDAKMIFNGENNGYLPSAIIQQVSSLGQKPPSDQFRKLMYAAKSGQMQLQNEYTFDQGKAISTEVSVQQTNVSNMANSSFPSVSDQSTTQPKLQSNQQVVLPKPSSKSFALPNGIVIPPPSNLGSNKANKEFFDQSESQRDSYFQRKKIVNLQRDKKQELINQLDQNSKFLVQNSTNRQNDKQTNDNNVAIAASGSQYLLNNHAAMLAYQSNNTGQALMVNNNFNPKVGNRNYNKDSLIVSGTTSGMTQQGNNSPQNFNNLKFINQECNRQNQPSDQQIIQGDPGINVSQKRRNNIQSITTDPTKASNEKPITTKHRGSDLNMMPYQYIQVSNPQTAAMVGISGKQIALTTANQPSTIPSIQANSDKFSTNLQPSAVSISTQDVQQQLQNRIARKIDVQRPHKVFDYMIIQMSNEQFRMEYDNKKIFVSKTQSQIENEQNAEKKKLQAQVSPTKLKDANNLDGLVQIKAFDQMMTDELPLMQCNLLPTQLDHVKILICEQEDKNYPKLTPDAAARFEIEKQNQIKQYMEDIIIKLQQKERKFKVTVKKKFIDDALYNSTSYRVASVYVIVVNREKTYDPLASKQFLQKHRRVIQDMKQHNEDSSDDEDQINNQSEFQKLKESIRRSANPNLMIQKNKCLYESDNNANQPDSGTIIGDKNNLSKDDKNVLRNRVKPISSVPSTLKAKIKPEDQNYRYVTPVKEFPSKYKETKIKICQDVSVHDHHKKHPINIFNNQYNEFVRLVFKNQKQSFTQKLNSQYAFGLARALGLNLRRDAFSEQNMKSREHICMLKEKLIFCFWKKLFDENKEVTTAPDKSAVVPKPAESETELDGGNSIDSTIASSNTPRSKSIGVLTKETDPKNEIAVKAAPETQWMLPHVSVNYKYTIGKGNNSMMVRSLFKNRYWWVQGDEQDYKNLNFIWTQNKVQKIFDSMACKFPNKKSGNKNSEFSQMLATPQQTRSTKKKKLQNSENQKKDSIPSTIVQGGAKTSETRLYNKIEDNFHMNNKKALFINMKNYYEAIDQDVFAHLPLTFHIKTGFDDPEFKRFEQFYKKIDEEIKNRKLKKKLDREVEQMTSPQMSPTKQAPDDLTQSQKPFESVDTSISKPKSEQQNYYKTQQPQKNIWIIKPGENTNRGHGIQVAKDMDEIREIISDSTKSSKRTCIVQKYIHNPLLINRRKFDIRTYALFTSWNGNLKAYIFDEGYLRTSCREYSINNLSNKLVHLTNDAVQKLSQDYGKFEPGNKLSYSDFQSFLDKQYPELHICFERDIQPQMNKLTVDIFRACHGKLDPKRRLHCMEVFGLDFMIDDEFRPYLIEVNTNPCLELSCPLLARLIPNMVENALKIGMDPVMLPPEGFSQKKAFIGDPCPENRFTLVYDDKIDGPTLDKLFQMKRDVIVELDEEFSDDEDVHDDAEDD